MAIEYNVSYGIGGWCEHCSPDHDHPLNNILKLEMVEVPDEL